MRATEFLLEYDRTREQQRIESVPAYAARLKADPDFSLEQLETADPTPQKIYVARLVTWWLRGTDTEDLISRGADALCKYQRLKKANLLITAHRDIGKFKTFDDFEDTMYLIPEPEKAIQDRGKYQELLNNSEVRIIRLLDKTASKYYGQGTRWCTAAQNNNMFEHYAARGPLCVILPKNPQHTGEKYQIHIPENTETDDLQFMNELDEPVAVQSSRFYPSMQQAFHEKFPHIVWEDNPSLQQQLQTVERNGYQIQYIRNPSESVQLAAVNSYGGAIRFIPNPSEQVQMAAINRWPGSFRHIQHPTEQVQMLAVRRVPRNIQYIKNPSEQVQLLAVRISGYVIAGIKNPTDQVVRAAVMRTPSAIAYVSNPSEEIQIELVKKHPDAIEYISAPSPAVKQAAKEALASIR